MPATFDGDNLLIILPSATPGLDAQIDLYSDWKEFVKVGDNAKYLPAFDTTGGDPVTATQNLAPAFFLRNDLGWRIRPAEESANISIVGNLYGRDPALPVVIPTAGAFTVLVNIDRSSAALVVTTAGGADGPALDEIVEGTLTLGQVQRILLAAMAGKLNGALPNTPSTIKFRDLADAKDRITAAVDGNGNRVTIVLDGS